VLRECGYCGGPHGRPRFPGATLDYSVSHTDGWLVIAVVGRGLVGVDVERVDRVREVAGLADAILTPGERDHLGTVPGPARGAWLAAAWTRKEAAMKVTGLGLRAGPRRLDVRAGTLGPQAVPRWSGSGPIHLYDLPAPAGHRCALAATEPVGSISVATLGGSATRAATKCRTPALACGHGVED